MLARPGTCCDCGSYQHTIPMPVGAKCRVEYIDLCVADIVAALTAGNVHTACSCCGHGKRPAMVLLEDGRCLHFGVPSRDGHVDSHWLARALGGPIPQGEDG